VGAEDCFSADCYVAPERASPLNEEVLEPLHHEIEMLADQGDRREALRDCLRKRLTSVARGAASVFSSRLLSAPAW
jgi:hypothetical protein